MRPSPSRQAYVESTEHGPLLAAFVLEYKRLQLYALRRTVISVLLEKSLTNSFFLSGSVLINSMQAWSMSLTFHAFRSALSATSLSSQRS